MKWTNGRACRLSESAAATVRSVEIPEKTPEKVVGQSRTPGRGNLHFECVGHWNVEGFLHEGL